MAQLAREDRVRIVSGRYKGKSGVVQRYLQAYVVVKTEDGHLHACRPEQLADAA